jgi:hypothetical protein
MPPPSHKLSEAIQSRFAIKNQFVYIYLDHGYRQASIPGKISDIENLIETYKYNQYIMQRTRLDNIGLHIIRLLARDSRTTYRNIGINKRLKTTSAKNIVESFYTDCFLCLDNKNRTNITQSMPKVLLDSHKA